MKVKKLGLTYKNLIHVFINIYCDCCGDQVTKLIVDHTLALGGSYFNY